MQTMQHSGGFLMVRWKNGPHTLKLVASPAGTRVRRVVPRTIEATLSIEPPRFGAFDRERTVGEMVRAAPSFASQKRGRTPEGQKSPGGPVPPRLKLTT
ncbi:unnamed protein product [Parascedosporium putredinis]|uniref:Uncharacterized protein n=1 Tax=Parascedosporium putredinis TaxID=1442378 RepID=A0A9P1HB54_9PEZI|nr:unnamed protein product [Parascedosporium putredinis]CAI8001957.1 unnamed protein product [Parascedosporium putredinis]